MATTNYNIRLDQELRDRAFSVFESYGLTPSQAIKLFLNQVAETNTVPLSFNYHSKPSNGALQAVVAFDGDDSTESALEG
ncbi:type II toxin-antitoxin system RelB/DinJ family antitoxin [Psychrobacter sp. P11G5]|uniref:type II toxin-antitoxin system RelB/DinJ family antitoxin n=1 Tax=Psychrobacter sp. P11G5 TaxID=1699624 RepID=UPI00078BDA88|nr:type II toxin-antitoxin system RelB/DinJ family antitoxin [Psychrobacter sp. P11G5]AMN69049.1 hypothetical protein AK825_14435 [Psychrobacter sp. P11G5]